MTTDVILEQSKGYYDIEWDSTGDIATSESFDTPILMGIFAEKRATASEVPSSFERRGWIGNESTPDFEMGSKLWQLFQAKASFDTLDLIQSVIRDGQQWLVDDNIATDVVVEAQLRQGEIRADLTLFRASSRVEKRSYDLWNATGNNL